MSDREPIARIRLGNPDDGGMTVELDLPASRSDIARAAEDALLLDDPSSAEIVEVHSKLPMLSAETAEDVEMLNDLASLAAALSNEEREAASLYWNEMVSVSEQESFLAAANVLMQAGELEQWRSYDFYTPDAGLPQPLTNIEKYGRTWYEANFKTPVIAYHNYDLALFGNRRSDTVALYDDGYLDLSADLPAIESYDRASLADDLEGVALPAEIEGWQKVRITARSLRTGEEFDASMPLSPAAALELEETATLGSRYDYEITEIDDGGVLSRLGLDPAAHPFERVETLNGLLILAATKLNAAAGDYDRVRALLNEHARPTYLDAAGAVAAVEEIPFYAYDFPNADAHDLQAMSKEEKWGRAHYDELAEAGELPEGKEGYDELIDIDFDVKTYAGDHDVALGESGYLDAYAGEDLNLGFYDEAEVASAAERAREDADLFSYEPFEEPDPSLMTPEAAERLAREMAEDAAMGRGDSVEQDGANISHKSDDATGQQVTPNELETRLDDVAFIVAEVPETDNAIGIAEVAVNRAPGEESSYYVIFDSQKRNPYGMASDDSLQDTRELDFGAVREAVERRAPNERWVRYGLDRELTPDGFAPDGHAYTPDEYRSNNHLDADEAIPAVGALMNSGRDMDPLEAYDYVVGVGLLGVSADRLSNELSRAIAIGARNRAERIKPYGEAVDEGEPAFRPGMTAQGVVYKSPIAFTEQSDAVAYIPEAAFEDAVPDELGWYKGSEFEPEDLYTYERILEACHGSRDMAAGVFAELDWQHPSTVYDETMRMLSEDWENADKSLNMSSQPESVRLYAECSLREKGVKGARLAELMSGPSADAAAAIDAASAIEELNRAAGPAVLFAEPVPEGHRAGSADVSIATEDPSQRVHVRVVYDYDARSEGAETESIQGYDLCAEDWPIVSAAVSTAFPEREFRAESWGESVTVAEAVAGATVPPESIDEIVRLNAAAAQNLVDRSVATGGESARVAPAEESPYRYEYMMLDRLKSDCNYVLGAGGPGAVRQMWAGAVGEQIAEMRRLWDKLPEDAKPEWLTMEQINEYEQRLTEAAAPAWRPGSIAIGRRTGTPYIVLDVTPEGRLKLGVDLSVYDAEMFVPAGEVDEKLVSDFLSGRSDGTRLAAALAEATGNREVAEAEVEEMAQALNERRSREAKGSASQEVEPWKIGSIAVSKTTELAFVVMGVTDDGRLLYGSDMNSVSPDSFDYGGQMPEDVVEAIKAGAVTEAELQEALMEIRVAAAMAAVSGPESEQPTWGIGSVALDIASGEPQIVTGVTESGALRVGYDMEERHPGAYVNAGSVPAEIARGYRDGVVSNAEKNRAIAIAMAEYTALVRRASGESSRADPGIDFGRSRWFVNGSSGWEFPVFLEGESESRAACGIEMMSSGMFVAVVEVAGENRYDLSPTSGFPTFDRAREAGMTSLGEALGLAPEVLAPYVHGKVSPDPYPEEWARERNLEMDAYRLMAKYGFDPDSEYVRTYPDGQWEALYFNPQGNEELGQIVQAWGNDLTAALGDYDPEQSTWISSCEARNNDNLFDWPDEMESILAGFSQARGEYEGFGTRQAELQHRYLVGRDAYLESMRTLDTERSDIFEDVPGEEYQMVAVAVGDAESEHAYVANINLREDGWAVDVTYDNGHLDRSENGLGTFGEARDYAMRAFSAGGRYSWEALGGFEGFQKGFEAADRRDATRRNGGWDAYDAILMSEGWGWEVSPDGVGRLMSPDGAVYAELLPERKQVIIMDEPIPGATTWTVDNEDVRLVLEACAIRDAGLEFDPPEGATFDGLIRDASKSLAKDEGHIPPRLHGVFEPLSVQARFERDLDGLFEDYSHGVKPASRESIYVSPTPGVLVAMGMAQRGIYMNKRHAMSVISPRDDAKHHHGLTYDDLSRLPELLAAPAIVSEGLEGSTNPESIVLILPHVNNDGEPLMAVIRPNEKIRYELETVDANRLASIYGKRNADNFLQTAVEQEKLIYVDKEKTEELASQTRLQLPSGEAGLPLNGIIRRSEVIDKAEGRGTAAADVHSAKAAAVKEDAPGPKRSAGDPAETDRQEREAAEARDPHKQVDEEAEAQAALLAGVIAAAQNGVAYGAAASGAAVKVEAVGFKPRDTARETTALADEAEARSGAAKVKKVAPAPQQAQKRQ